MPTVAAAREDSVNWQEYEKAIRDDLAWRYPDARVTWNARALGRHTGLMRQLDVLIEQEVCDATVKVVVDAKLYSERIDLNEVETFLGLLSDVGAHRGLLITSAGYSEAALRRAHSDPQDLELDILSVAELGTLQGEGGIPYSGNSGAVLRAPFGWILDAARRPGMVATLYRRGLTLDEAIREHEWSYINFWEKSVVASTIEQLAALQEEAILENYPTCEFERVAAPPRNDARTAIRFARFPGRPAGEYTGFVEFKKFLFFIVAWTPELVANRNLRKVREVLRSVLPLTVTQPEAGDGD